MPQPPLKLKLDGKQFNANPLKPSQQKLLDALNSAPTDEIYTGQGIADRAKLHRTVIYAMRFMDEFKDHTMLHGKMRYWGSKEAIQELARQLGGR